MGPSKSPGKPSPSSIDALLSLRRSGHLADAEVRALELLRDFPDDLALNEILAGILADQRRFQEAIPAYRKAIEIKPASAEAHCNLANALAESGQIQEALESFRTAIEIKPDFADAHNMLGMALKVMGKFDDATANFEQAIAIQPDFVHAHNNLATEYRRFNRLKDSAAICRTALQYDPRSAEAYYNLGSALHMDGQPEAAIDAHKKALEIKPNIPHAHDSIGRAFQGLGRFAEAIAQFDAAGNSVSQAWALECCFALGRVDDYRQRLDGLCRSDPTSRRVASISTFAAHQWGTENPYSFCRDPLDFITIKNVKSDFGPFDRFSAKLMQEIETLRTVWEPPRNTTINGYHTIGNLFEMRSPNIITLSKVLSRRIDEYRSIYADRTDTFITQWPKRCIFSGWHVRLVKDGYQKLHNHPSGWLSGVLYLKMPENLDPDQGAITFTLQGPDYPILNQDIPKFRHSPKEGDLVLFPSSLFHYTSPFHTDAERQVVAFDLGPSHVEID